MNTDDNNYFDKPRLQEQVDKVNDLIAKFSPDFEKKIRENPYAARVFDLLLHGGDVYQALEHMIDANYGIAEQFKKYIQASPPAPILMTQDHFKEFKDRLKK